MYPPFREDSEARRVQRQYAMLPPVKQVVLVVDDEESNVKAFARTFRRELDVRTACSASEALRLLCSEPIEFLITDYTMPGTNGIELLRRVQELWPHVGRILLSGHFDLPELVNAQRTGLASAVLGKPWDVDEIRNAIRSATSELREAAP